MSRVPRTPKETNQVSGCGEWGGGSFFPPLVHAGPTRGRESLRPQPKGLGQNPTLPRQPKARKAPEKPRLSPHHAWSFRSCQKAKESTRLWFGELKRFRELVCHSNIRLGHQGRALGVELSGPCSLQTGVGTSPPASLDVPPTGLSPANHLLRS